MSRQTEKEVDASLDPIEVLKECITQPGAYCLKTLKLKDLVARLSYINSIAGAVVAKASNNRP
jgi:hypothetical protein